VSYYYDMPDGSRLSQEQFNDYKAKKIDAEIAAERKAQDEAARLVAELSEAYKACAGFMAKNPKLCKKVGDAEAQEHELYLKLRRNLERADSAPRCEKVSEDGTACGCPKMTGYSYCYAHERMLQARPRKLALPPLEDANGIQLAIMMVQKALIDDEISEKKAGLLLYSMQIAASNVKQTTFVNEEDKEVVTEMPEEPAISTWQLAVSNSQDNTHDGDTGARRNAGSGDRAAARRGAAKELKSKLLASGSREAAAEQISPPLTRLGDSR
jgi:hypothetical protein